VPTLISRPALLVLAALLVAAPAAGRADEIRSPGKGLAEGGPVWMGPRPAAPARRVVVLAPSLTDVVLALGLRDRLVGVTRHDDDPQVAHLPRVGGYLDPNPEAVVGLQPDLVVWVTNASAVAPVRRIAELSRTSKRPFPVLALQIDTLADVLATPRVLADALGERARGERLSREMADGVEEARRLAAGLPRTRVLFVVGREPLTVAGRGSFPDELLRVWRGKRRRRRPPVAGLPRRAGDRGRSRDRRRRRDPGGARRDPPPLRHPGGAPGGGAPAPERRPHPARPAHGARARRAVPRRPPGGVPVIDTRRRLALAIAAGLAAVLAAVALSVAVGAQRISVAAAFAGADPDRAILFGLRLPRALVAAVVGCALAGAGTALQALLRNPLAEPFVLGVSGGAALGGSVVLVAATGLARVGARAGEALGSAPPVAAGAIAGAALATVLVFGLGRIAGRLVPEAALLVGIVFNAFVWGVITLMRLLVPPEQASRLTYWLVGAVGYETAATQAWGAAVVAVAIGVLIALSAQVNLLTLGDEEAAALGLDVRRARAWIFFAASAATGAAVALAGMVGFVGLIVPHLVRRVIGPDHRLLVPGAALFGAAFLVLADALARLAFVPLGTEPPVGAVTAFLGGPFFLWLLRRTARAETAR
jgi:iron complex transport system permease protein